MKKHTIFRLLILFFLIIASACEKPEDEEQAPNVPLDITKAELTLQNSLPVFPNEEIEIYVFENVYSENIKVNPEKYVWSILDSAGTVIKSDFSDQVKRITWVSEETGKYTINLKL